MSFSSQSVVQHVSATNQGLVKYVALLAFNKIVTTHSYLVSQQEDVILECVDSPDVTIRIQALDLVQGMVTGESLVTVVSRLMKQLKYSSSSQERENSTSPPAEPNDDSEENLQVAISRSPKTDNQPPPLPENYRIDVIRRILHMCAKDDYSSVMDFDWYIDVLTQLVRMAPVPRLADANHSMDAASQVSEMIGDELRNVAVKVRAMRGTAVRACEMVLAQLNADTPSGHSVTSGALKSITWILGEYTSQLSSTNEVLNNLLQLLPRIHSSETTALAMFAILKLFAALAGDNNVGIWTPERKSVVSLLMARIIDKLEPFTLDPSLDVQERAVELVELLKLAAEAAAGTPAPANGSNEGPPLLLAEAIPSLFRGWELNSVARGAQRNVPAPDGIDLDVAIHANLEGLLAQADMASFASEEAPDEFEAYYNQRQPPKSVSSASQPAIYRLVDPVDEPVDSYQYQQPSEESYLDGDIVAKRRAERVERNRDDPFYIPNEGVSQISTPIHHILQNSNGPDLDIDSIPIMELDLDKAASTPAVLERMRPKPRQKVVVDADETLQGASSGNVQNYDSENNSDSFTSSKAKRVRQGLLGVDSSHIGAFNLEGEPANEFNYAIQQREDAEMQQAMKEVERLRLEMQRANERIHVAQGVDAEGAIVKKKKKKKKTTKDAGADEKAAELRPKKTKKKKVVRQAAQNDGPSPQGPETAAGEEMQMDHPRM